MVDKAGGKFQQLRGALWRELTLLQLTAHIYDSIVWVGIKEIEIIRFAPGFFMVIERALWSQILLTIFKLMVDKHKGSRALVHKYLDFVEGNKNIFMHSNMKEKRLIARLNSDRRGLERLEPVLNSIMKRRHNFYAHYNEEYLYDPEKMNDDFPLSLTQIKRVIKRAAEMLSWYSELYDESRFWPNPQLAGGTEENIFALIRQANERLTRQQSTLLRDQLADEIKSLRTKGALFKK